MNPNYTHTITLYNCLKAADGPNKKEKWYRHVLDRCFYKAVINTIQNGTQASQSNTYTVRIPEDKRYLSYAQWIMLPEAERADYFTASSGDIVIQGECPDEITGATGQAAVQVLNRNKPDAFKVTAFADNTFCRLGKHYRLGG